MQQNGFGIQVIESDIARVRQPVLRIPIDGTIIDILKQAQFQPVPQGAGPPPRVVHRFYHVPASNTAVGHLILENT